MKTIKNIDFDEIRILVEIKFYIIDKQNVMICVKTEEIETNSSTNSHFPQFDIDKIRRSVEIKAKEIRYYKDNGASGLTLVKKDILKDFNNK